MLDDLVLNLIDKETLSPEEVLEIFAPIKKRPSRGSYTGYGKRLPLGPPAGAHAEGARADRRRRT